MANNRLQVTHKSASPFVSFQAVVAALLCAPEPKRYTNQVEKLRS